MGSGRQRRAGRAWHGLVGLLLALPANFVGTGPAMAQESTLRLNGGLGAGTMMSEDQLGYLGYDGLAGRTWAAVGHALSDMWVLEGHGASGAFGSSGRDGGLFEIGAGMRFDYLTPMHSVRLSPAAHLNMGITGGQVRPTFSVSVGMLFDLSRAWALGPTLQYGQVFQPDGPQYSSDARYFSFGVGIGYRPAPDAPPAAQKEGQIYAWRMPDPVEEPEEEIPAPEPTPELLVLIEEAIEPLVEATSSSLIPPILFEHDSVALIPCGEAALYYARDAINARKDPVTLEGHADKTGDVAYNVDLAQRRAEVVREWLIAHGVSAARLEVASQGECCGLAEETDDGQRQINRRVVIRFGKGGEEGEPQREPTSGKEAAAKPAPAPAQPAPPSAAAPVHVPAPPPAAAPPVQAEPAPALEQAAPAPSLADPAQSHVPAEVSR
ncbi:MAG: OmpA family protein [Myxococcales bacterium]|nr:OmpA family protein [Myxococcales bacterium]